MRASLAVALTLFAFVLGYQAGQLRGVAQSIDASMRSLVDALPRGTCGPLLLTARVNREEP